MHPYLIEMFWSEDDQAWLCTAPDLPGCSAGGNSPVEAVREMEDAIASWVDACANMGKDLPQPLARPQKAA